MGQISGAETLVMALKKNGVKRIYGVVGIPVTDFARLAQNEGIDYVGFRREDAAVNAAAIAGCLNQEPGISLTVSAPGFMNGIPALAAATVNGFPMIMISGSSQREIIDLSRGDYEELDQYNVAKPFVKAAYRIDRPQDIGIGVARAFRTAISGRPGGVYLDVPADMLQGFIDKDLAQKITYQPTHRKPTQLADEDCISEAKSLLLQAKKPLVIIGKGAAYARAEEELKEFVEKLNIPYLPMSMAKGLIDDTHHLSMASARSLALKEADVILLIGARLNWLLSHGEAPKFNPDAKFIQMDIKAEEFDSNRPISVPLLGDIKSMVRQLSNHFNDPLAIEDWMGALQEKKEDNIQKISQKYAQHTEPMGFYEALHILKQQIDKEPDTYLVSEGANTLDLGRNIIDIHLPRHRLDVGTWGVMGIGLGYAVGAALETGKKVIALEGDSAFGFSGMEVETICRYNLPIVIVVMNNGGIYSGVDTENASSRPSPTQLSPNGHYEKLMEAFGGEGYYVKTSKEFETALQSTMQSNKPCLINVELDNTAGSESGHLTYLNPKIDPKKGDKNEQ